MSFEKSDSSNLLQLADTVAYNVWRQSVDNGLRWDQDTGDPALKMYEHFERISDYFYANPENNQVKGYGIIKLPDPEGAKWRKGKK